MTNMTAAQANAQSAIKNARRVNRQVVQWKREGFLTRASDCRDVRHMWMNEARMALEFS